MTNETDAQGRKQGKWVEVERSKGLYNTSEGWYKNHHRHGYWIIRKDDGTIEEGSYYEGKKVGEWMSIDPDNRSIERFKYDA